MELSHLRAQIDDIDAQLTDLFGRRLACSRAVAAYKKETGAPVLDEQRQRAVLARAADRAAPGDRTAVAVQMGCLMDVSRAVQYGETAPAGPLSGPVRCRWRMPAEPAQLQRLTAAAAVTGACPEQLTLTRAGADWDLTLRLTGSDPQAEGAFLQILAAEWPALTIETEE